MSAFILVNQANFNQKVLQSQQPVLVEFGAAWCGPCQVLEPILEKLAEEWGGQVVLAKVNVDESVDLTLQYHVLGVPTLLLFVGGEARMRIDGYSPRERIRQKVEPFLNL